MTHLPDRRQARSIALLRRDTMRRCLPTATPTVSVNIHLHPHVRDGNNALACPRCGEQYLNHQRIVVFDRHEDDTKLTKTTIDCSVTVKTIRARGSGNPSYRRHGLAIRFWCEQCDQTSELTLEQHKGNSFLGWRWR
jgi:DNA-directed RNA polymerase subunit M/transcription elongation factor TFIIS